jgi:hypothetical protein
MQRIAFMFAAALVCATCGHPAAGFVTPPPPPPAPGTAIRVVTSMDLLDCPSGATAPPPVIINDTMSDNPVHDGAGDVLNVRARGARRGTSVSLQRQARPYRAVDATASGAVTNAAITLDITDCAVLPRNVTVVRHVSGDTWEDVGDGRGVTTTGAGRRTVSTGRLTHLSIYALAGGN